MRPTPQPAPQPELGSGAAVAELVRDGDALIDAVFVNEGDGDRLLVRLGADVDVSVEEALIETDGVGNEQSDVFRTRNLNVPAR